MLKSMTGYGRGEVCTPGRKVVVELKSVNHRYCEVSLRLPRHMMALEDQVRRLIVARISRGRVDGYLSAEYTEGRRVLVKVDKALAAAYYKAVEELKAALGLSEPVTLPHLLHLPGVLVVDEPAEDPQAWWPYVREALEQALDALVEMRAAEGARLKADLLVRLERVAGLTEGIKGRAPQMVQGYYQRLCQRVKEWQADVPLDPGRLAAEVAIFAERSDISEETVRLESHISQFRGFLESEEPVGRKLDFLLQEMFREVNTIASKAPDLEISRLVVEAKSELEKMREQVQNVE